MKSLDERFGTEVSDALDSVRYPSLQLSLASSGGVLDICILVRAKIEVQYTRVRLDKDMMASQLLLADEQILVPSYRCRIDATTWLRFLHNMHFLHLA